MDEREEYVPASKTAMSYSIRQVTYLLAPYLLIVFKAQRQ